MSRSIACLTCGTALPPCLGLLALAWTAVISAREVGELSQAGVQAAFQILRQDYIRSSDLDFATLNRAALEGLLSHLQAGARIVPLANGRTEERAGPEVLKAQLADRIGWVRPVSYAPAEAELLASALTRLRGEGCEAVILDLRQSAPDASFETAAGMLECFVPEGRTLFRLVQAERDEPEIFISTRAPVWEGAVIALVNGSTSSVGETIAAVLRRMRVAMLAGESTRGATARYQTLPLDERHALQYASSEMLLADGASLFQKGLTPDLEVAMSREAETVAVRLMRQGRVRELVHEQARPRFNEAALVARRNPELESYLRRSSEAGDEEDRLPQTDPVLQRAVDLLQATWHLQGFKLTWKETSPQPGRGGEDQPMPEIRKATPVTPSQPR